jgi:N-acetylglutamate synthase-like GNAT family acetyltransferase
MQIRKALPEEYDEIYRMGFDVWGDGETLENYLDGCRSSPKYQQGYWYVLVDDTGTICSSLIRYSISTDTCGIGSIATPPALRKKGHASMLIVNALKLFECEGFRKTFLFSDIESKFYEKFGFSALSHQHQNYKKSVCMVRGVEVSAIERDAGFQPPKYF